MTTRSAPRTGVPAPVESLLSWTHRYEYLSHWHRRLGPVFQVTMYPIGRVVYVSDPDVLAEIFSLAPDKFRAGEAKAMLRGLLGDTSILLADGELHRTQRRLTLPTFGRGAIARSQATVEAIARRHVAGWPVGRPFRSLALLEEIALDVIIEVFFGLEAGRERELDELKSNLVAVPDAGVSDVTGWMWPRVLGLPPWRGARRRRDSLHRTMQDLISERRRFPPSPDDEAGVDRLIAAGLSDADVRHQLLTLLMAGYQTTSVALAWSMERLVRNPAVLAAVEENVRHGDGSVLDSVVAETLRSRTTVFDVTRKLDEDVEIAGYRIERGVTLMPGLAFVHDDARNHACPGEFRPERFAESGPDKHTWVPFGGGARRCIGANFSLMEMRTVLGVIIDRFDLQPDDAPGERPVFRKAAMVPAGGAKITVRARGTHV